MKNVRRSQPPVNRDVTITIPGLDRYWVAEALIEAIRQHEEEGRSRRGGSVPLRRQELADRLRAIYDEVVP